MDVGLKLLLLVGLIAVNAFFVAAEFSIVSVRRSRIHQLVDAGDIQAKTVQELQQSIDRLLSTTQLGITLACLGLGWIGDNAIAGLISTGLQQVFGWQSVNPSITQSLSLLLTFMLIAYLQIVLGELCPKSVALLYPEQLSRFLGAPSQAIGKLFNPFIWVLNRSTQMLLSSVGIQYTGRGWTHQVTSEELQLLITSSESTGLEAEERQLLTNVFEFGEVTAGEVMVPRTNIDAIPCDATLQIVLEEVANSGHSRYPVIGESLDDIRGILNFKELAEPIAKATLDLQRSIQDWIRPARFVPEYTPLNELLALMQRSRQPMVMVVDEFGGTAGLVTIENLIIEIIGDTIDSSSTETPSIQVLDDQTILVQAQVDLEEVNEALSLDLPITDDYQTLAGFVLYELQRIPQTGERFYYQNHEFIVASAEGPRLNQIQIRQVNSHDGDSIVETAIDMVGNPSHQDPEDQDPELPSLR
jgi:CBS domain containing-hemolysin-like protein